MKPLHKYLLLLLLLNVLLSGAACLFISFSVFILAITDIVFPALSLSLIATVTLIIFFRGQTKDAESQTLHSLLAIGLKFLLELVLALVWFFVAKKTSLTSVIMFFVLYLTLTLFSVWIILKTLKNRSL